MKHRKKIQFALVAALVTTGSVGYGAAVARQPVPPDFTKGERVLGDDNAWSLGATGAHGEIWAQRNTLHTAGATQIYVTKVDPDTPASDVLAEGDVILGVVYPVPGEREPGTEARFAADARKELAAALMAAEQQEHAGRLVLSVWRGGETREAGLTLRVMGAYSETSPRECRKSEEIITRAGRYLEERGFAGRGGIATHLDALGLLATGDTRYLPMVREYAHRVAPRDLSLDINQGMVSWNWAYTLLFLTEYHLATKDDVVLPAIREYATKIAMGQSGAGTWGHSMAMPAENGGVLHGPPCGYGAMNQIGLTCTLSLVMARKCGVVHPEIEQAVKRATEFLRFYVDKGSLPYGDHDPWGEQDDNGKNSQAAVLFDLLGDEEAATYFSRMALASYEVRERGHTGHFFSFQWGALGAARTGDEAAAAFMRELRWFYELERRPGGNFVYQRQLANTDHNKYTGWSTTGSRLLHYCLPRRQLYITGKGPHAARKIEGLELQETIAAGRLDNIGKRSPKELLQLLGNWSPTVRDRAGKALAECDESVVAELIAMLESKERYARYGACKGLRYAGRASAEAVDALVRSGLRSGDLTMRWFAMDALRSPDTEMGLRAVADRAAPQLVKMAMADYPDESREWTKTWACYTLCGKTGILNEHPETFTGLARATRVQMIRALLQVQDGRARGEVGSLYAMLDAEDLVLLWGPIYQATKERAPSGTMFADGIRARGIDLMARHGVKEGLELSLQILREDRWGRYGRKMQVIPALKPYGAAAKAYLPELKTLAGDLVEKNKGIKAAFDAIENDDAPELISIAEYLKNQKENE